MVRRNTYFGTRGGPPAGRAGLIWPLGIMIGLLAAAGPQAGITAPPNSGPANRDTLPLGGGTGEGVRSAGRSGPPAHVLVVLSSDDPPYQTARSEIEKRLTEGGQHVQTILLDELVKDPRAAAQAKAGVDVFLAVGTKAAIWLHEGSQVKPPAKLIYCMVANPEAAGLLAGTPVAGVSTDVPLEEQLKLIAQALPAARTVGLLYRTDQPKSVALMKSLQQAASKLSKDWKLEAIAVNEYPSVAAGLEALFARKIDLVWTAADASVYDTATVRALLLASVRKGKPVFGFSPAFVKAGALIGIGIDPRRQGEQAAQLALRACDDRFTPATSSSQPEPAAGPGQPDSRNGPSSSFVENPRFQVAVNLIVAEQISVQLPEAVVSTADMVFKPEGDRP